MFSFHTFILYEFQTFNPLRIANKSSMTESARYSDVSLFSFL